MSEKDCKKCLVQGYRTGLIPVQLYPGKPGWILKKCECVKEKK